MEPADLHHDHVWPELFQSPTVRGSGWNPARLESHQTLPLGFQSPTVRGSGWNGLFYVLCSSVSTVVMQRAARRQRPPVYFRGAVRKSFRVAFARSFCEAASTPEICCEGFNLIAQGPQTGPSRAQTRRKSPPFPGSPRHCDFTAYPRKNSSVHIPDTCWSVGWAADTALPQ